MNSINSYFNNTYSYSGVIVMIMTIQAGIYARIYMYVYILIYARILLTVFTIHIAIVEMTMMIQAGIYMYICIREFNE
jgi:hypothetical protein